MKENDSWAVMDTVLAPCSRREKLRRCFRFFDLPYELRATILAFLLNTGQTVDLHPENYRSIIQRLPIFLTSRRMHAEAYNVFYGRHTFRILPTHGRFFGPNIVPLIGRLSTRYREALNSLELRLGPGWNQPPSSWRMHDMLGLEEMCSVRTLKVFVEMDPSQDAFKGFRTSKDFYTVFCSNLFWEIIKRLPKLGRIELDAWPSVRVDGDLISSLLAQAEDARLEVSMSEEFALRRNL